MSRRIKQKNEYSSKSVDELLTIISDLEEKNYHLTSEIFLLRNQLFGSRKERIFADPEGMRCLFNEAEEISDFTEENKDSEEIEETTVDKHKRKKRGFRKPLPKYLPRIRQEFDLTDEQKICKKHHVSLERIGSEVTEKLDIIPAKVQVLEQVTFTYKCPCCENHFEKSKKAPEAISKSYATPGLLAYIATAKYEDALPLNRQEKIFQRHGIDINRTTMARWIIKLGELCQPLINLCHDHVLSQKVLHIDETVLQVLKENQKRAESKSYMWTLANQGSEPVILYYYHDNRSFKAADEILDGYSGYAICDAYKVYDKVSRINGLTLCGCWAHCRRKFWNAEKIAKQSAKKGSKILASEALSYMRRLYKIERDIEGKPPDKIKQEREEKSKAILHEFHEWLEKNSRIVLPKSQTGKAISYALEQWKKLERYCEDGHIAIDNNYMESHIRPFAIGRKNWIFCDTPSGAHASATIYSLVESAKANGIQPFDYLNLIFKELPLASSIEDYEKILPYNAAKHFQLNTYTPSK